MSSSTRDLPLAGAAPAAAPRPPRGSAPSDTAPPLREPASRAPSAPRAGRHALVLPLVLGDTRLAAACREMAAQSERLPARPQVQQHRSSRRCQLNRKRQPFQPLAKRSHGRRMVRRHLEVPPHRLRSAHEEGRACTADKDVRVFRFPVEPTTEQPDQRRDFGLPPEEAGEPEREAVGGAIGSAKRFAGVGYAGNSVGGRARISTGGDCRRSRFRRAAATLPPRLSGRGKRWAVLGQRQALDECVDLGRQCGPEFPLQPLIRLLILGARRIELAGRDQQADQLLAVLLAGPFRTGGKESRKEN